MLDRTTNAVIELFNLGGPVVLLLLVVSIVTLTMVLYKLWQFSAVHVGQHNALRRAVHAWDAGDKPEARRALRQSRSYLAPIVEQAFESGQQDKELLQARVEERFARLEKGFRYLDMVAQLAPLLGLFGTVLGMIEAFQALQEAGAQVDPSILAGGIWVALLTTAVGLAVAMPTSMVHAWLEGRMDSERVVADNLILTVLRQPGHALPTSNTAEPMPRHG